MPPKISHHIKHCHFTHTIKHSTKSTTMKDISAPTSATVMKDPSVSRSSRRSTSRRRLSNNSGRAETVEDAIASALVTVNVISTPSSSNNNMALSRSRSLNNLMKQQVSSFPESFQVVGSSQRRKSSAQQRKNEDEDSFLMADFDDLVAARETNKKGSFSRSSSIRSNNTQETYLMDSSDRTRSIRASDIIWAEDEEAEAIDIQRDCFGFPIYDLQADKLPALPPPKSDTQHNLPRQESVPALTPAEAEKLARRARRRKTVATKRNSDSALPRYTAAANKGGPSSSSMRRCASSGGLEYSPTTIREQQQQHPHGCHQLPLLVPIPKQPGHSGNGSSKELVLMSPRSSHGHGNYKSSTKPRRRNSLGDAGMSQALLSSPISPLDKNGGEGQTPYTPRSSGRSKMPSCSTTTTPNKNDHAWATAMNACSSATKKPNPTMGTPRRRKSLGDPGLKSLMRTFDRGNDAPVPMPAAVPFPMIAASGKSCRRGRRSIQRSIMADLGYAATAPDVANAFCRSATTTVSTPAERRRSRRNSNR